MSLESWDLYILDTLICSGNLEAFFLSFSSLANNESSYLALDDSVRITCFYEGKPTMQITHCLNLQCTDRRWLSMALESDRHTPDFPLNNTWRAGWNSAKCLKLSEHPLCFVHFFFFFRFKMWISIPTLQDCYESELP